eukprot:1347596-Rhodomonas_salina.2
MGLDHGPSFRLRRSDVNSGRVLHCQPGAGSEVLAGAAWAQSLELDSLSTPFASSLSLKGSTVSRAP